VTDLKIIAPFLYEK